MGTHGGSRAGTGGARPGAGRPKKAIQLLPASPAQQSPLDFMLMVMRDPDADLKLRLEAAKTAAPYIHSKSCEIGIKDQKHQAAKKAASGKFATPLPPATILPFPR